MVLMHRMWEKPGHSHAVQIYFYCKIIEGKEKLNVKIFATAEKSVQASTTHNLMVIKVVTVAQKLVVSPTRILYLNVAQYISK